MKRAFRILLWVFALLTCVQQVEAQRFIGSVVGGVNAAQIEGDDVHGFYKFGANVGAGVSLHLDRKQAWSVSTELLFVQKGARKYYKGAGAFDTTNYGPIMFDDVDPSVPFNPRAKCNIRLDYVQIPLLFSYEDMKSGCSLGLGFSWSRLVGVKEIYNGFTRTTTVRSHTYNTSDWSVLVDVGIRLYKNLTFNVRYEYSMVPIRLMQYEYQLNNGDVTREIHKYYNHLLSFRLQYFINEKYIKNTNYNRRGELIGTKWIRDIPDYD